MLMTALIKIIVLLHVILMFLYRYTQADSALHKCLAWDWVDLVRIQNSLIQPVPAVMPSKGLAEEIDKIADIHYRFIRKSSGGSSVTVGKHVILFLTTRFPQYIVLTC